MWFFFKTSKQLGIGLLLWLLGIVGAWAQVPGFEWAVPCGSAGSSDYGVGASQLAVDGQGNTYVLGSFAGTMQLGSTTLTATSLATNAPYNQYDIFVAKLDGQGQYQWASAAVGGVLAVGPANKLYMATSLAGTTAPFGPYAVSGAGPYTGVVARLGAGPLATVGASSPPTGLQVWPNPVGSSRQVRVAGVAAGQAVQVLDVLGRVLSQGRMPGSGPLELALPATLPAGVYVVRGGSLARSLVVE